jgi:uncharacterized membrane protein
MLHLPLSFESFDQTLNEMPKATKLLASTVKVADLAFWVEHSSHTMVVLPLPFPLRYMYCLFFGTTTCSLQITSFSQHHLMFVCTARVVAEL